MFVKEILKEQGIKPSKQFGQSFLVDEKIAERIIRLSEISQEDVVLEVGPGLGILTQYLCAYAKKVFAVEKDPLLFRYLTQKFFTESCGQGTKNLVLLNQDILSLKVSSLKSQVSSLKIVSNLPYSITNDFLYWILSNRAFFKLCILTLQKEVVQRLCAQPGSKIYGALSVFHQFYMELEQHFSISGNSFFPRTPIVSQVISILPKSRLKEVQEPLFFKVVKRSFQERRKQLKNSLGLKIDTAGGIDLSRRPESLSCEEFVKLTRSLSTRVFH
ncbi:ribosomal RNA small subunit methyltransferase A [candidate division WOR-3 bacterium]|nr:ribosomal RNA small subunit methyltransferase A [candidate division WOR-3 bacterium]